METIGNYEPDSTKINTCIHAQCVCMCNSIKYHAVFNQSNNLYAWTQTICAWVNQCLIFIHRSKLSDHDDSLPKVPSMIEYCVSE